MQEQLIVILFIGLVMYGFVGSSLISVYDKVLVLGRHIQEIYSFIVSYVLTRQTFFIILALLSPLILYPLYKLKQAISRIFAVREEHYARLTEKKVTIQELLRTDLDSLTLDQIPAFISTLYEKIEMSKEKALARFTHHLTQLLQEVRIKLRELNYATKTDELDFKKKKIEVEIKNLKDERERQHNEEKSRLDSIRVRLNIPGTNAFFREALYQEEINILRVNGYEDANEYDVLKKKIVPVLVKKIMNHTKTHTFLVWSVEHFLRAFDEVTLLQHHDTRYPDITFTIGDYDYAIEIETGPLLRKKRMSAAKVSFLNRNYPGRWMFVVSNKNLLSRYRKLGPATQRSEVVKTFQKWLEISL